MWCLDSRRPCSFRVRRDPKEVSYSEFLAELRAGHQELCAGYLAEVQVTEKQLIGVLQQEKAASGKAPVARILTATRLPGI